MINVTLEKFKAFKPCRLEQRLSLVEHLFPLTCTAEVRIVAMLWSGCNEHDPLEEYEDAFVWLATRVFDATSRKTTLTLLTNAQTK